MAEQKKEFRKMLESDPAWKRLCRALDCSTLDSIEVLANRAEIRKNFALKLGVIDEFGRKPA